MADTKKYKLVKNKGGKNKVVKIYGVKKQLYVKVKTRTLYVVSKGKMMKLSKYKQMKKTANANKKTVKRKTVKRKTVKRTRKIKKTGGARGWTIDRYLNLPFWDVGLVEDLYEDHNIQGIRTARFTIDLVVLQNIFPDHINNPYQANSFRAMRENQAKVLKDWIAIYYLPGVRLGANDLRKSYIKSQLLHEDIEFYNKVVELENQRNNGGY